MSAQAYPMPECQYQHSYDRMVTELILDRREAYIQGINDTLKLLGKTTPKNEETTQYGLWVARDRDGKLILFTDEPIKDESMGVWDNFSPDGSIVLADKSMFPEVTWETEPKKVKMTLWV